MKILVLYTGPKHYYGHFVSSLDKITHTDGGDAWFPTTKNTIKYGVNHVDFRSIVPHDLTDDDVKLYDVVIGLDTGCLRVLSEFKNYGCKIGCQILDYPEHTFKDDKNYIRNSFEKWEAWKVLAEKCDFFIHCKPSAKDKFTQLYPSTPYVFHKLPVNTINVKNYQRKDYIVYSGVVSPQKGVHYIIDALGIIENPPQLVVIGQGSNLSSYAQFLRVPYTHLYDVSENDKFRMYHECRFLVYGHDSNCITSLAITEGLGIGRTATCFNYPEHQAYYGNLVNYCAPRNIESLARSISFLYKDREAADRIAENGPAFVRKEHNFDIWAETIYEFLQAL